MFNQLKNTLSAKGKWNPVSNKPLLTEVIGTLVVGFAVSFMAFALLELSQSEVGLVETIQVLFQDQAVLAGLQIGVIASFFLLAYALFGSKWIGGAVILVTALFFSIANGEKLLQRTEPLYPADLTMVKNTAFLLDMVDATTLLLVGLALAIVGVLTAFFFRRERKNQRKIARKTYWGMRAGTLLVSGFLVTQIFQFHNPESLSHKAFAGQTDWKKWRQELNYKENGFVTGFLYNLNAPAMEKVDGYSREAIQELADKYRELAGSINAQRDGSLEDVNVIYVMNETFTDPMNLESLSLSGDPIPEVRQTMEEHVSGTILAQGFGGGTANVEFEALTGISLEPLSDTLTTPFIQMTDRMKTLPSATTYFNGLGHSTTAMHPYSSALYKRYDVYNYMGFDTVLFEEDIEGNTPIENNPYITDQRSYEEVLSQMEETPESDFIHLVTMFNHGGYYDKYEDVEITVEGLERTDTAQQYYRGLQISDSDTKDFFDQVEDLDEKTIVVFWGDHLPGFYENEVFTEKAYLDKYETPVVLYSNFDTHEQEEDMGLISPIHFMNQVKEMGNAPLTPFDALLVKLEEVLPAFEKGRYIEAGSSEAKESPVGLGEDTLERMREYELLLYDLTTGENHSQDAGFFDSP